MSKDRAEGVWLVTGSSSGLGAAIVRAAAARGARVVATARDPASIEIPPGADRDRLLRLQLDITDREQRRSVVAETIERFGSIDVLVNNAGRMFLGAVEECSDEDLRAMFDLQLFGPTDLIRLVLPGMRSRRRGTIVQMSSMGAHLTSPATSSYTASKAALESLSAALAVEVRDFGIRVLIVEPGSHRTEVFTAGRLSRATPMPDYAEAVGRIEQMFRDRDGEQIGDPDRAAEAIVGAVATEGAPLRLPLGTDAVEAISASSRAIDAEVRKSAGLAGSTAYRAEPTVSS